MREKLRHEAAGNFRPIRDDDSAIAVAVGRQPRSDVAPKVLATGRGALAARIIEIAHAAGVRVREDEDLAQLLSVLEEDCEIPIEAFEAVSEILSYVYRANGDARPETAPEGES